MTAVSANTRTSLHTERLRTSNAKPVPAGPGLVLSDRRRQVLTLVAEGHTNARIGRRLGLTVGAVEHHVSAILRHLDARDRAHAVAIAMRAGLLS